MKAKILIILILLTVYASSCRKEVGHFDLTEAQLQLIPPKGKVFRFIDEKGQVVDLTTTESKTWWEKQYDGLFIEDYVSYRVKSASLISESNNIEIYLEVLADSILYHRDYGMVVSSEGYNSFIIQMVQPDMGRFYLEHDREANFNKTDYGISFYDSLEINSKIYFDVIEQIEQNRAFINGQLVSAQLFYNKTHGILQIKRDGKDFLTINENVENSLAVNH